jgi:sugar phosphate isomerase/epimerase
MLNLAKWCQKAGATRAVIHLGGTKDREPSDVVNAAKEYWAQQTQLHDFLRQHQIKLLIENVAAAYPTNQDLEYLISITKETPDILGWCLDTAHANAAGVSYDTLRDILSNPEKKPDVVHCNYPGSLFRSGRDVHGWYYKDETPLQDDAKPLWEDIVKTAYRSGCPLVVEGSSSPGDHQKEVLALIALCESNTKANP